MSPEQAFGKPVDRRGDFFDGHLVDITAVACGRATPKAPSPIG
jgi:hypothetical protein